MDSISEDFVFSDLDINQKTLLLFNKILPLANLILGLTMILHDLEFKKNILYILSFIFINVSMSKIESLLPLRYRTSVEIFKMVNTTLLISCAPLFLGANSFSWTFSILCIFRTALIFKNKHVSWGFCLGYCIGPTIGAILAGNALNQALIPFTILISITILDMVITSFYHKTLHLIRITQDKLEEQRASSINSAKMATLGEMASGIAHEINNPLTIVMGKAEQLNILIKDNPINIEMVNKSTNHIINTVERISKIVMALKKFSREADNDPLERISIKEVINDTLNFCNKKFTHSGIHLKINLQTEDFSVMSRGVELSQVLLNLLNNAFDAVITGQNDPWIEISAKKEQEKIKIAITNSGPCIDKKTREKLFLPFFTTKEVGKGTGLGLSVSRNIIKSLGGNIFLDENNPSTSFVVELPLIKEK